jgi:hypothetical protein
MATVTGMAGAIMGMAMAGAIMVTAMVGAAGAAMHPVAEVEEAEEVGVEGEGEEVVVEEEGVVEAEAVAAGSEPDGPTLDASSSKFAGNEAHKHE